MPDNIENYLKKLKVQGKRGRVTSSRADSKKNIGKRTGKTISGIGGVADVSGLFRSFDSDSNASAASFSTKRPPLNSTFKTSKDVKRRPEAPSYDNSDSEDDNVILLSQPTEKERHDNQDSSYHSNSQSPVDKSALESPGVSLSKTYVDQGTQCMTPPDEDSPDRTKDASHINAIQVSTAAVTSNVISSGRSSGKSQKRDQRQANALSSTKSFRGDANTDSQTSKTSEDDFPSTPGSQSNILNEYRQMISAEKSRSVVLDGTKIGSLTKKNQTPTYSKQTDLRRRLSFKTGVPDGRSPRAVAAMEAVTNATQPDFELDRSSSRSRNEVIVEADDPNAAEKIGLAFVPTPKINHPSLLKRRRSSAKKDHRSSSKKSAERASAKQKLSSKSKSSEPEKPEMESEKSSRGRPKIRQKLFHDASDISASPVKSAGRPQPKSKKSLDYSNSRWDTSTSGERQSSKSVKKSAKAHLVIYSSSSDEEYETTISKTKGRTSSGRSPLKSVQNNIKTTGPNKKSERKEQSYRKSSEEDSEGVRKTSRKRQSLYKTLAESDIEYNEEPRKTRASVPKSTKNKKAKKQQTTKKQQSRKSGNEADDSDAGSDVPPKKRRSTGIHIAHEHSGNNEEQNIANISQMSSRRIRNRFYSESSSDSENEKQKTVIKKNNRSTDRAKLPEKTKRAPRKEKSDLSSNPDSDYNDQETLRETDDAAKLPIKHKSRSAIDRKNDHSASHNKSSKRHVRKKDRKSSSKRDSSCNRVSSFDHSESETNNTTKVRGKRKSKKETAQSTASSSLQAWLDSGHGTNAETIRLPTPRRDTSPDLTKSAAISRRSKKVIMESDENPLESEPDHPPLPVVDESAINNTSVEHGGGRSRARALGRIGPPASTPRAGRRVAALSRRNLEAHAREEPAAPNQPDEVPVVDNDYVLIHTDTEEDSRDYVSDDSYTLRRKPQKRDDTSPLKKPTTKKNKSATSKLEIISVDMDVDNIASSSNGGAQRSRGRKYRVDNESTTGAHSPRKRRKDNRSTSGDKRSQSSNNESKSRGRPKKGNAQKNTSTSGDKRSESINTVSKGRGRPKKKNTQKKDENDRTLVAGDNENTLTETTQNNQPAKSQKSKHGRQKRDENATTLVAGGNENTVATKTTQKNRPAKSKKSKQTKMVPDILLPHQRELDLVIPQEDDDGLRRSKRVRPSRPFGYGEKLVYEMKNRVRTLVGIQTDNGFQKIDVESHQGETVHIQSQSVLVKPTTKRSSNKTRPGNKKKQNQKSHNESKRPRRSETPDSAKQFTHKASTSRREADGGENAMQWFDDMNSASARSSMMEQDTTTDRTVQLFDNTKGGLAMFDVSSIVVDGKPESAKPIINEKGVNIMKCFKSEQSICGKLDIEPRREKESRIVHKGEMVFYVARGRVKFSVGDLNVTVQEEGTFKVLQKNQYSLFNPSNNVKAKLFYTMIKEPQGTDKNAGH